MRKSKRWGRFFAYAAVGAVGTAVQWATLIAGVSLQLLGPVAASIVGAAAGAVVNYFLNARFTFSTRAHASALPRFAATALMAAGLNGVLMHALVLGAGINYLVSQMVSTLLLLCLTYLVNLVWTFRPRPGDMIPEPDRYSTKE
jgi:putative flippase GtrA